MPRPCASSRARAHRLRRAAAELAVVLRVRPQLERHADGLARPPRATSSAATALSTPPLIATSVRRGAARAASRARARRLPSARCSASAASSAAWRLAGLSPPSSSAISSAPMRAAPAAALPRTQPDGGAAGGDRRAAAAGVKAGVRDPPLGAGGVERERDAHQIAARRPAGGAREGVCRAVTAPQRSSRCCASSSAVDIGRV